MSEKVKTNFTKGSIASVSYKRKTRLLLWGGAAVPGDNSAFEWAARNVVKSYQASDKGSFAFVNQKILVAAAIVATVNRHEDDSVRSLDIFTHGGPQALYLTTASPDTNKLLRYVLHNSSLYRSRAKMILNAAGWTEGSALVSDINFSRFTDDARIELHGCKTADAESDADNIAADLSKRLHAAGKKSATVIGHADKANPNIKGGGEKFEEQDYRHGQRVIFWNGKVVKITKQAGHISDRELAALATGKAAK